MYPEKTIQAWVKNGELKTYEDRFICEIGMCQNQQKVPGFTIQDLVNIAKINYNQFKK